MVCLDYHHQKWGPRFQRVLGTFHHGQSHLWGLKALARVPGQCLQGPHVAFKRPSVIMYPLGLRVITSGSVACVSVAAIGMGPPILQGV